MSDERPHPMTVYKLDFEGQVALQYEALLAERAPEGVVLRARWTMPDRDLGYATFRTGDYFTEYYYHDRWYNVFRIESEAGDLRGWYCNITRPAEITADAIRAVDLALDLWIWPDRRLLVLDQEDFDALPLTDDERAAALAGLAELQRRAQAGEEPFVGQ